MRATTSKRKTNCAKAVPTQIRDKAPSSFPSSFPYQKKSRSEPGENVTCQVVSHTFAIENNIRRLPEDINSVHNILARRADGKSNVERHREEEYTRWR